MRNISILAQMYIDTEAGCLRIVSVLNAEMDVVWFFQAVLPSYEDSTDMYLLAT